MDSNQVDSKLNGIRVVLGMAKSNLDMRGAKAPKLELDFVRLVMAVHELINQGYSAKGYLGVATKRIQQHVLDKWHTKYDVGEDEVSVILILDETRPSDQSTVKALRNEKRLNAEGNKPTEPHRFSSARATIGEGLETPFKNLIMKQEPELAGESAFVPPMYGIRWDFFNSAKLDKFPGEEL